MNFNNIYALGFLSFIPIVILFYLYKNKSKNKTVPSLFIWERVLKNENNKKRAINKLKRNLLLLLQILAIIAFSLFIAEPYLKSNIKDKDIIIILDCSINMMAENKNGVGSFLDEAKQEIGLLLRDIKNDSTVSVIKMGKNPEILNNKSSKNECLNSIKSLECEYSKPNVNEALALASKISDDKTKIYVFSSQELNTANEKIDSIIIGGIAENTAIISAFEDLENNTIKAQIKNNSNNNLTRTIMLYGEDKLIGYEEIDIKANSINNISFENIFKKYNYYKIQTKEIEQLKEDDVRYLVNNVNKDAKIVLLGEENYYLNKAINATFKGEAFKADSFDDLTDNYNLYIFNKKLPAVLPKKGNILIINPTNNCDLFSLNGNANVGELKANKISGFEYLSNLDFEVTKSSILKNNTSFLKPVVISDDNPIIYAGKNNNQKIVIFNFDLYNSDLVLKIDYPIMIKNLFIDFFKASVLEDTNLLYGDYISINSDNSFIITTPSGNELDLNKTVLLDEIGVYGLEENDKNYYFCVNPSLESEEYNENLTKPAEVDSLKVNRSLKNIFGWLTIILLIIEWLVFNNET